MQRFVLVSFFFFPSNPHAWHFEFLIKGTSCACCMRHLRVLLKSQTATAAMWLQSPHCAAVCRLYCNEMWEEQTAAKRGLKRRGFYRPDPPCRCKVVCLDFGAGCRLLCGLRWGKQWLSHWNDVELYRRFLWSGEHRGRLLALPRLVPFKASIRWIPSVLAIIPSLVFFFLHPTYIFCLFVCCSPDMSWHILPPSSDGVIDGCWYCQSVWIAPGPPPHSPPPLVPLPVTHCHHGFSSQSQTCLPYVIFSFSSLTRFCVTADGNDEMRETQQWSDSGYGSYHSLYQSLEV